MGQLADVRVSPFVSSGVDACFRAKVGSASSGTLEYRWSETKAPLGHQGAPAGQSGLSKGGAPTVRRRVGRRWGMQRMQQWSTRGVPTVQGGVSTVVCGGASGA